jgi:hypothetical protein
VMKEFGCLLLLICLVFFAAAQGSETISAGSFRVTVPTKFAKGAVVEKVAMAPCYTPDEWETAKREQVFRKFYYGNRPQHWAIRLPGAAPAWYEWDLKSAGEDPTAPQILIHKADEWAAVFQDGKMDAAAAAASLQDMRRQLELSANHPDRFPLSPAVGQGSGSYGNLTKSIQFRGGSGVRGITDWGIEADLVRRGRLHYLFLGLSDDGTCQIIATFPLDLPGLPDDSLEAAHLGYSASDYGKLSRELGTYMDAVDQWIAANANHFTPKLEELDSIIAGLVVKRWE